MGTVIPYRRPEPPARVRGDGGGSGPRRPDAGTLHMGIPPGLRLPRLGSGRGAFPLAGMPAAGGEADMRFLNAMLWWWGLASLAGTAWLILFAVQNARAWRRLQDAERHHD